MTNENKTLEDQIEVNNKQDARVIYKNTFKTPLLSKSNAKNALEKWIPHYPKIRTLLEQMDAGLEKAVLDYKDTLPGDYRESSFNCPIWGWLEDNNITGLYWLLINYGEGKYAPEPVTSYEVGKIELKKVRGGK